MLDSNKNNIEIWIAIQNCIQSLSARGVRVCDK